MNVTSQFRRWLLLPAALLGLCLGVFLVAGWWPVSADIPAGGATNGDPGNGGLRRAFPAMKERADNPSTPERVELGRLLFFDPVISGDNTVSCATCHHPDLGFADGRNLGMGRGGQGIGPERAGGAVLKRTTPSIWNAAYYHRLFWDGRAADLEEQAASPITAPDEMNAVPDELVRELMAIPEYVTLFNRAFNNSGVTFENTTRAIAAFERTLVSHNSPFDRYAAGEATALTPAPRRGLTLFRSLKTRCFECHGFPTFANPDFKVIGVPDWPGQRPDLGRAETGAGQAYERAFKVPSLRNVALTAPYMHNGRLQTLDEVIHFYAMGGGPGLGLNLPNLDDKIRRFTLTRQERQDLVAFLEALTDESRLPVVPERVPSGLPVVAVRRRNLKFQDSTVKSSALAPSAPRVLTVQAGDSIQAQLDRARPGDTIEVRPGVYHETLLVDINQVTIRGLTEHGRRAVLDGEKRLTDAVITSSHDFTIEGFVIKDYLNNGITAHGGTNVAFRDLEVHSTGLYGVYPVECRNVTIERVLATGIRDAAIYVGQSRDIIVRDCEAHGNVTGIEIENSVNALVENNYLHDNTAGVLVFLLPNNPSKVGSDCRVIGNRILNNNIPNFGDKGAIVSKVAPGSGMIIMAADRTEVARNEIRGNNSFGIAVVSLEIIFPKGHQFDVGVLPEGNWIHDNTLAENGRDPQGQARELGIRDADLFWDGSGWGNLWEQPGAQSFPAWLPSRHWPDVASRAYARAFSLLRHWMM